MIEKILKLYLKKDTIEKNDRSKIISITSIFSIFINMLLAVVKLLVGVIAGSVAIISDAVNNLTDAVSSIITILGLKLSEKAPDRKHPLGYGRLEYVSSMVISAIVLITGFEFLQSSIKRIINPTDPNFTILQIIVLIIAIGGKILLSRVNVTIGKKTESESLVASGIDARMDVFASTLTVIAAIISRFAGLVVDGWMGALLSVFIIYNGATLVKDTLSSIIGERPSKELANEIRKSITKFEPIMGAYDLIIHNYGPSTKLGSVNLEIPDVVTVEKAYDAMRKAREYIYLEYGIYFTFGFYSVNTYNKEIMELEESIKALVYSVKGSLNVHAFNYDKDENYFRFDVVVDFSVKNFKEFKKNIIKKIEEKYPGAKTDINIDLDYS
ncbi:MAG: cation diffusion facilitator family transporter [Lachnospiraceae bacterium]|nr:cation diffusion facilitator family transporter [Lachnospiraceae bacterium]